MRDFTVLPLEGEDFSGAKFFFFFFELSFFC